MNREFSDKNPKRSLMGCSPVLPSIPIVIPAKAGIHTDYAIRVDPRLRGDDKWAGGDDRRGGDDNGPYKRQNAPKRVPREGERGVALLIVLVSTAILTILVFELAFSTGVQSRLSRTFEASVSAKYLAKSAQNLALLRVYVYLNLLSMMSSVKLPFEPRELEQIYSAPIPPLPFDEQVMAMFPVAVRIGLEKFAKESVMGEMTNAQFVSDIRGLSGAIPVNLLDGEPERFSSLKLRSVYFEIIKKIIAMKIEEDESFQKTYGKKLPEDFVWNLVNYIDLDNLEQPTGQIEDHYFLQFDPPEFLRHRRFQFKEDLALPKEWDDNLVSEFGSLFNLYAFYPYININTAPSVVSKLLVGGMPDEEQMDAFSEKVATQGFRTPEDLKSFREAQNLQLEAGDLEEVTPEMLEKIIGYHEQTAFKINASGIVGDITQEYSAIVIFKPAQSVVDKTEKEVTKKFKEAQIKIQETGDIENEEFNTWKNDPFGFFPTETEEERETADAGEPDADPSPSPAKKKKDKQVNIFSEPPQQMQIVYWGNRI